MQMCAGPHPTCTRARTTSSERFSKMPSAVEIGPAPKRARLDTLKADANEVLRFELLAPRAQKTLASFSPLMTHQVFGDDEIVIGHADPKATVSISSLTLESTVEFESTSREAGATKVAFTCLA